MLYDRMDANHKKYQINNDTYKYFFATKFYTTANKSTLTNYIYNFILKFAKECSKYLTVCT